MTITELKASIDHCFVGCTESPADKARAINRVLDMFNVWRDDQAKAYLAALEVNPDLSPAAFSTSRNRLNQVA